MAITLTSIHSTSPYFGQGVEANDTTTIDAVTTPDGYAVTEEADGTVRYAAAGATSRQIVNCIVRDVSAAADLPFEIVFNDLAPTPAPQAFDDPILVRKSVAMTAFTLLPLALDPEGDTVIATSLNALPTGLSVVASELVGTPTVYGRTTDRQFRWTDQYGATLDASVTIEVGDLIADGVGLSQAAAEAAIAAVASMTTTVSTAQSGSVAAGDVISQSPPAGTLAPHDQVVELVVSLGNTQTAVPNLIGQSAVGARSLLTSAQLLAGTVSYAVDPDNLYRVVAQSQSAGAVLNLNTSVGYTIGVLALPIVAGHGRARRR